jgi:hypothetical protein
MSAASGEPAVPRPLSDAEMADPGPAATWEEWSKDVADTADALAARYPDPAALTFAREAERALGELRDLANPEHGRASVDTRALALGFAAVTNALLSVDEALRSGTTDAGNVLADIGEVITDAGDMIAGAVDVAYEARRPWWRWAR